MTISSINFAINDDFPAIVLFLLSVGLQKILSLLTCDELDVQIHAVKVVANLAAEGMYKKLLDVTLECQTFYWMLKCQSW